jgi:hypothetical protein
MINITTEEVEHFERLQGCPAVKVILHTYFDDASIKVKKESTKCANKPHALQKIAIDGGACRTTTKKW